MLKLKSDFYDYYDHAFDRRGADCPELNRMMDAGPDRKEVFRLKHVELRRQGFDSKVLRPENLRHDGVLARYTWTIMHTEQTGE